MADVIEVVFRSVSAEEFQRALRGATNETKALDEASKRTAGSTKKLDESLAASTIKLGQVGTALSAGGSLLSSFAGKGDETTKMLGNLASKAGMVVAAFATTGPWGAAITGATVLLGEIVGELNRTQEAIEDVAQAARRAAPTMAELVQLAREGDTASRNQLRRLASNAAALDPDDVRAATTLRSIEAAESLAETERKREELRKALARAQREGRSARRGGERGNPFADDLASQRLEMREGRAAAAGGRGTIDLVAEEDQRKNRLNESSIERLEQQRDRFREMLERQDELAQSMRDSAAEMASATVGNIDQIVDAWERANEAAARTGQQMLTTSELMQSAAKSAGEAVLENIGETATAALRANIDAWMSGEQSIGEAVANILKTVVKGVALESTVKAIFQTAEGIAALASLNPPKAAGHFAAAGVYAATAAAAGGVGVAIGAFGGGAGAGAGARGGAPAAPARPVRDDERRSGPTTVVVNLNAPNAVMTQADGGRLVKDMQRAAGRIYGAAA